LCLSPVLQVIRRSRSFPPKVPKMDALPPPTKTAPFPIVTGNQKSVLGVAFTFAVLPVIAVSLRIVARRIASRALDASDYCIIIACILAVALEGVSITGVLQCGIGYDHTVNIVVQYGMEPVTKLLKVCTLDNNALCSRSDLLTPPSS
jgi:hypothetical protein